MAAASGDGPGRAAAGGASGGASGGVTVYTAIAGGYDVLLPPRGPADPGLRHVAFTDRPPRFAWNWEVRPLPPQTRGMAPRAAARWCKINAHLLLPGADVSVWLDGNIRRIGPVAALIAEMEAAGAALATFRHPQRGDIRAEAAACARLGKLFPEDEERIEAQLARYRDAGLPDGHVLMETGVLLRDHRRPELAPAMELWWDELRRWTKRDQISLPWVLHATGLPTLAWDWTYREPNRFFRIGRNHRRAGPGAGELTHLIESIGEDGPAQRALLGCLRLWRRVKALGRRPAP